MEATVFFKDGHSENVLYHSYTKDIEKKDRYLDFNFKFKTASGLYLYVEYINIIPPFYHPKTNLPPLKHRDYKFYKYRTDVGLYEDEWLVTDEITKIEFYDKE